MKLLLIKFCIIVPFIEKVISRNAIDYFASRKKVNLFSIKILTNNSTNLSSFWVEYYYLFDNLDLEELNENNATLTFGTEENASNLEEQFSLNIFNVIETFQKFRTNYVRINEEYVGNKVVDLLIGNSQSSFKGFVKIRDFPISDYALVYNPRNINTRKDVFVLTFVGTLWLCFLLVFIILALFFRISTNYYCEIKSKETPWSWVEITLWAIAASCQQGLSYTPNRFTTRFIFLLGYLMAYLLYTAFAAAITSILLRQEELLSETLSEIDQTVKIISCKFNDSHFKNIKIHSFTKNIGELFNKLNNKNSLIGLAPKTLLQNYVIEHRIADDYVIVPLKEKYKFALGLFINIKSKWKDILKKSIFKIDESGISKYKFQNNINNERMYFPKSRTSYSSASLSHVGSAIYLFITGVLASILFIFLENCLVIYKRYRYKHKF